jgi:hypothetical protein
MSLAEGTLVALREAQPMTAYAAVMHLRGTLYQIAPGPDDGGRPLSERFVGDARYDAWLSVTKVVDALRRGAEPGRLWTEALDKVGAWRNANV